MAVIVTLCGSVRFEADFKEATRELGVRGITTFTLSVYPSNFTEEVKTERGAPLDADHTKVMLDLVHLEKILRSDAILVVGDGYVGKSTAREILWADLLGKRMIAQTGRMVGDVRRRTWDEIASHLRATGVEPDHGFLVRKANEVLRAAP